MEQELFQAALVEAFGSQVAIGEPAALAANAALFNRGHGARPCALVNCLTTEDVRRAVQLATEHAVPLSVLGGGRHWAGLAVVQGGLVLNMRPMSQVHVARGSRTVTLGGGSLINDALLALPDDLAIVTGAVSNIGYPGLVLGGGLGPLNSRFGLACDTMRSAQVVLANGSVVTASAEENPDLFWALRGGGGNYGVVTEMALELFSVPKVQSATILFPQSSAGTALSRLQEILEASPDELSVLSGLVTLHNGQKGVFLQPLLIEDSEAGERLFDELCRLRDAKVVARRWCPYKEIFDREAEKAWSANQNYRVSSRICEELNGAVVDLLMRGGERAPTPGCAVVLHDFRGQASRIPIESAAYPLRKIHYVVEVIAGWNSDADGVAAREWWDQVLEELSRLSLPGGYPNVLGPEEKQRTYDFYKPSRARLQAVKTKFDPHNVFSSNVCQL